MESEQQVEGVLETPVTTTTVAVSEPARDAEPKTFSADFVQDLRREAANYRTQLRDAQAALKKLQDGQANVEELRAQLAALETSLAEKTAAADKATREATVLRLAPGIDPDVLNLLDLSKLDLSDEAKARATLARLAAPAQTTQAKPGSVGNTGLTEAELRERYWGSSGRKATIFGE